MGLSQAHYGKIRINFGKYKGKQLQEVPIYYLKWAYKKDCFRGKALIYCKTKLNVPKYTYEIKVEGSANVSTDGTYTIEAYSAKTAIEICKTSHSIQETQSYHGTCYTVTKLT